MDHYKKKLCSPGQDRKADWLVESCRLDVGYSWLGWLSLASPHHRYLSWLRLTISLSSSAHSHLLRGAVLSLQLPPTPAGASRHPLTRSVAIQRYTPARDYTLCSFIQIWRENLEHIKRCKGRAHIWSRVIEIIVTNISRIIHHSFIPFNRLYPNQFNNNIKET